MEVTLSGDFTGNYLEDDPSRSGSTGRSDILRLGSPKCTAGPAPAVLGFVAANLDACA
jgi:hypothetical protein